MLTLPDRHRCCLPFVIVPEALPAIDNIASSELRLQNERLSCSLRAPQAPSIPVRSQAAAASAVSSPYPLSASQPLPGTRPQGTSEGAPVPSASMQQFLGSNPGASLQMSAAAASVLAHGTAPGADGAAGVVAPLVAGAEQEGVEVMPLTPVTGHMVR